MAKFNPQEFDYSLHSEDELVNIYQKNLSGKELSFIDTIELGHWKKINMWVIGIKSENLKKFLPEGIDIGQEFLTLFIGEIKSDFDFRFIMTKIIKDPKLIAQMGS